MAEEMGISIEELVMTMESGAEVESLHKTIYQVGNGDFSDGQKLPEKRNRQEKYWRQDFSGRDWGNSVEAKGRRLIYMRYFPNYDPGWIAHEIGVSQVLVIQNGKEGSCAVCGESAEEE